jgi:hypothetical protein
MEEIMNVSKIFGYFVVSMMIISTTSACFPIRNEPVPPTLDPQVITQTVAAIQTEAVQTAIIQATLTELSKPTATSTSTPIPTDTPIPPTQTPLPSLTPLPTNTYIPPTHAPTFTSTPAAYQCTLISQSPAIGATYSPGADFDGNWKVKNTGTKEWDSGSIDFSYLDGTKFQKSVNGVDLKSNVSPGGETSFIVDMLAPKDKGTYTAHWGLVGSGYRFCVVTVTITVK